MIDNLGVVIPVYNTPDRNRTSYLVDSVESALAQDLDYTLLIVDNGSTDEDTLDFYETLNDPRVRIERIGRKIDQKGTPSVSLNYGFRYLFGIGNDAFCYLHSDDILTEGSLERRVNRLEDGNDMVYGRLCFLFGSGLRYRQFPLDGEDVRSSEVLRSGFPHHTSMWSRRMMTVMLFSRHKYNALFDESMEANEDIDVTLYCRKLLEWSNLNLGFDDCIDYIWRDHPGNITNTVTEEVRKKQSIYAFEKNEIECPSEYTWKHTVKHLGSKYIPVKIKDPLRPLRNLIRGVTKGRLFPSQPLLKLDLNPYWFREKELSLP